MNRLNILWTTDNPDTIRQMLVMYAVNSLVHDWWSEVNVIIWGASARCIGSNAEIQKLVKEMIDQGVKVEACKECADKFQVSALLESMGVDVRFMGAPLTDYLKAGETVLTI